MTCLLCVAPVKSQTLENIYHSRMMDSCEGSEDIAIGSNAGWVAKMLKEGQTTSPFNDDFDVGTINRVYEKIEKGKGYGLSFQHTSVPPQYQNDF